MNTAAGVAGGRHGQESAYATDGGKHGRVASRRAPPQKDDQGRDKNRVRHQVLFVVSQMIGNPCSGAALRRLRFSAVFRRIRSDKEAEQT